MRGSGEFQSFRPRASRLVAVDRRASSWVVRKAESCRALRRGSVIFARAGDGLVWVIVGVAACAVGPPDSRQGLLQVVVSALLTAALATTIKFGVRRVRPLGPESAKWSAMPEYDLYSFPSGHAARAACIATSVFMVWPPARIPFILWAVGVCWARVAVAAHYLFDVLAGMLIGALVGGAVARVWPALLLSVP